MCIILNHNDFSPANINIMKIINAGFMSSEMTLKHLWSTSYGSRTVANGPVGGAYIRRAATLYAYTRSKTLRSARKYFCFSLFEYKHVQHNQIPNIKFLVFSMSTFSSFSNRVYSTWHGLHKFVRNPMIRVLPACFENYPKIILCASTDARKSDLFWHTKCHKIWLYISLV